MNAHPGILFADSEFEGPGAPKAHLDTHRNYRPYRVFRFAVADVVRPSGTGRVRDGRVRQRSPSQPASQRGSAVPTAVEEPLSGITSRAT